MAQAKTHLIIVCCHGIWLGGDSGGADEAEWLIAPFQRGETATFVAHARTGAHCLAEQRPDAVLVFSGGPTRRETRRSEAESYRALAAHHDYWGAGALAPDEVLTEERALDSYHNVLFGLTRFRARFGAWPARVTLVGHAFKRPRLAAHCAAIGLPRDRVAFDGEDPPGGGWEAGAARAADEWRADPHGRSGALRAKRRARNPWAVWQGVFAPGEGEGCGRGGLCTVGEGEDETLVDEAPRPWL
ncbi:hypothetical protein CDD83_9057 [Cordyceps sp. RAO-2017]|nr:hypothetical protein CDD83_9057 [Cordyceps sp. RAO-2017]